MSSTRERTSDKLALNILLNEGKKSTIRCSLCDLLSLIVPSMGEGDTVASSFSLSLISYQCFCS